MTKRDITAVILAGGQGKRAGGKDKGQLMLAGKSLIEHVLRVIKPQVNVIIISANRNLDFYKKYEVKVVEDIEFENEGPLAGILAAMNSAKTSFLLTVPVDMPFLPSDLVEKLASVYPELEENAICIAHDGQRTQHGIALIPIKLKGDLFNYLEEGNRKWQTWIEQHSCKIAHFEDATDSFRNINTLKELDEAGQGD